MAVRKSAVKKSAKTAVRRTRAATPSGGKSRRRPTRAAKRSPIAAAATVEPRAEDRLPAVLPVPMATFVF